METFVTTVEFYQEMKSLANGNEKSAKIITDYIEQSKANNMATLKDVFLTKDDKVEILKEIGNIKGDLHSSLRLQLFAMIALFVPLYSAIVFFLINYFHKIPAIPVK